MTEPDSCGKCEITAETYRTYLEEEKRTLLSFRGHGLGPKPNFSIPNAFSNTELKTFLKLILLGCNKLHFIQNTEPIDTSFGRIRIASKIENIEERLKINILSRLIRLF